MSPFADPADAADCALAPVFTPHGRLLLEPSPDAPALDAATAQRLREAFARRTGHGLLRLGAGEGATALPAAIAWWRDFAARYVTALCALTDADEHFAAGMIEPPADDALAALAASAPPTTGAERLTAAALAALWHDLDAAFAVELAEAGVPVQDFLRRHDAAWNLVGRVHFNLAENRGDDAAPFAFLATYTTGLSAQATARHLQLERALQEGAEASSLAGAAHAHAHAHGRGLAATPPAGDKVLEGGDLAALFGLDIVPEAPAAVEPLPPPPAPAPKARAKARRSAVKR